MVVIHSFMWTVTIADLEMCGYRGLATVEHKPTISIFDTEDQQKYSTSWNYVVLL